MIRSAIAVFVSLLALCGSRTLRAQVLYGSLTGNVADASGAAVPGARVNALQTATGFSKETTADDHGVYLLTDLLPGAYRITFTANSFRTMVQENVQLEGNNTRRLNVALQLAQVSQSLTVDASAMALQTDRSDVSTQLATNEVANLPLGVNRNFQTLYKLVPGASPPIAAHSSAGNPTGALATNVNGGSDTANSTLIDGTADPNFWELNIIAYVPPAEAIQTVNVVTGSFDAEQGQAGASVVNLVVKSGTNSFHGAAWEYNTDSDLKARNFFYYGANNPKNILNQFGLALGGPIVKNKLFFFVDWERYLLRQSVSGLQSVPTDALKQGNFSSVSTVIYNPSTGSSNGVGRTPFPGNTIPANLLSSAAMKLAGLIPEPNQGAGISNNYFAAASLRYNRDNADLKINYNPSEKTTFFARYSAEPTSIFDPQALGPAGGNTLDGGQPGTSPGLTQSSAAGANYTLTPHLLLDGNVGFTRQNLKSENTDITQNYGLSTLGIPGTNGPSTLQGGYPVFTISGFSSLGNASISSPFVFRDNEYLYAANLSWVKGSHSLRFGTAINRFQLNHFQAFQQYGVRGGFSFTGGLTALNGGPAPNAYNAWADFMLGLPQAMGKDYQYVNPGTGRESTFAFYARDQWQMTRKLTLSYGLRYELFPFPTRDHTGGANYDPTTNLASIGGVNGVPENAGVNAGHGEFAPRLGLAYRVSARTVIRSGFGINSDPYYFTYMIGIYPTTISQQLQGANSYANAGSLANGLPAVVGPNLSLGSFPLPANVGTNAYPKDFNRGYVESYNFIVQSDLGHNVLAQAGYVGTHTVRAAAFVDINAAAPGGGNAGTPLYQLWGNPNTINELEPFNGGSYNSLQAKVTHQIGSGQIGVIYTFSRAIDYADEENSSLTWAWSPMWGRDKALASYDRTQNFEAYTVYDLPFGKSKRWLTHGAGAAILGGWSVNSILSRMSGTPFSVSSSGTSVNAPGNSQTADQVLASVQILGGHGPNSPYFNPAAFAPVTAVRFGTSGRDILRGPGIFNLDASLIREFGLKEHLKLQFRAEAFGLTNTPQFSNPSATVSNATFSNGAITNLNGYDIISSSTGERQLRFALRLSF